MSLFGGSITTYQNANGGLYANANAPVSGGDIAPGSITNVQIANNTILATNIANNTITAAQIAPGTITATQIANNTITNTQIANDTITSTQLDNIIAPGSATLASITWGSDGRLTAASSGTLTYPVPNRVYAFKSGTSAVFGAAEVDMEFNQVGATAIGWAIGNPVIESICAVSGIYHIHVQCTFTNVGASNEPLRLRLWMNDGIGGPWVGIADSTTSSTTLFAQTVGHVDWTGPITAPMQVKFTTDTDGVNNYRVQGDVGGFHTTFFTITQVGSI